MLTTARRRPKVQQDARQAEQGTATASRDLVVNGEACASAAATLGQLVRELGYGERRIATAVNGQFVAGSERDATPLEDGDRVEIVAPRQGG